MNPKAIYQDLVLNHSRQPHNRREIENPDTCAHGDNPLCGDSLKVYLNISDNVINDISFEGVGCAISIASSSMMTKALKGMMLNDAMELIEKIHTLIQHGECANDLMEKSDLRALSQINQFPVRTKCASLSWHTTHKAINQFMTQLRIVV